MAQCEFCDDRIYFLRDDNTRWTRPLEITSSMQTVENDGQVYRVVVTYRPHECEEMKLAKALRKDRLAKDRQEYARSQAQNWQLALTVACPKCGVGTTEKCVNLTTLRRHNLREETRWPHPDRVDEAARV